MNATTVRSNVKAVINIVIEEINGVEIISTLGTKANGLPFSAADLFAPLTPAKPVAIAPPLPEVVKPEPKPTPKPNVATTTLETLKAEAKALHVKGAHLFKDETKLKAAIETAKGSKPTTPAPSAPQVTTPPAVAPSPKSSFKKGSSTMKKDSFKLSKSSLAIILTRKGKEKEVYITEQIKFNLGGKGQSFIDENIKAEVAVKDQTTGFVVCSPDEGCINEEEDTLFGGTWVIPYCRLVKWVG
jgi:hypothetical protein